MTRRLSARKVRRPALSFTPRQWDIIEAAGRDLSNRAIAEQLGISERTVEDHLRDARVRASVQTTRALLARAGARPRAERADPRSFPDVDSPV